MRRKLPGPVKLTGSEDSRSRVSRGKTFIFAVSPFCGLQRCCRVPMIAPVACIGQWTPVPGLNIFLG